MFLPHVRGVPKRRIMSVKKIKCEHDAAQLGIEGLRRSYLIAKSRGAEFIFFETILLKMMPLLGSVFDTVAQLTCREIE